MTKHIIKVLILALWVSLLGWWWQESRSWPVPEKIEAAFLPEFYDHFSVSFNDKKVGWATKNLTRLPSGDYQAGQSLVVNIEVESQILAMKSNVLVNMSPSLELRSFQYILQVGDLIVVQKGTVAGEYLSVTNSLGDYGPIIRELAEELAPILGDKTTLLDFDRELVLPAPSGPAVSAAFPPYLSHLGLVVGRNYSVSTFNPLSRALVSTSLKVEEEIKEYDPEAGRDQPVFKVRAGLGREETFLWLNRYGRTLREKGQGFALTRVDSQLDALTGIEPLTLPPLFKNLVNNSKFEQLMERVEQLRQKRQKPQ